METLFEAGVRFPVLHLLPDWVSFCPNEANLSKGLVRGRAKLGEPYKKAEGVRFVDQTGKVFVVAEATVIEDKGLFFEGLFWRVLDWFGAANRVVTTKLLVEYSGTLDFDHLRAIVIPALENAVRVIGDQRKRDLRKAKAARTVPQLIAAAE